MGWAFLYRRDIRGNCLLLAFRHRVFFFHVMDRIFAERIEESHNIEGKYGFPKKGNRRPGVPTHRLAFALGER